MLIQIATTANIKRAIRYCSTSSLRGTFLKSRIVALSVRCYSEQDYSMITIENPSAAGTLRYYAVFYFE